MLAGLVTFVAVVAQAAVPAAPPATPGQPRVVAQKYGAMGTEIILSAWTADQPKAERAFAAGKMRSGGSRSS